MEETRFTGRDTRSSLDSAQTAAEKIVGDAEARSPVGLERQPTRESTSSYLGMTRKEAPVIPGETPVAKDAPNPAAAPTAENPAPSSSALEIPTLAKRPEPSAEEFERQGESGTVKPDTYISSGLGLPLLSENPTPLSSAFHIPTLINESKPARER